MRHLTAPDEPPDFEEKMPSWTGPPARGEEITGPWKDFKPYFSKAQHGKCAYCEVPVTAGQHGDVEHFRPKSEISELRKDESTWGKELPDSARVVGRKTKRVRRRGYWWVAYRWDNYLLSCELCNRQWKKSIFPVDGVRARPPDTEPPETPLLLNPFRGPDPCKHLHFRADGAVEPWRNSRLGRETIKTCGLDRPSLTACRKTIAKAAFQLVRELEKARGAAVDRKLRRFYEMGSPDSFFPGMVQAIFRQETGIDWRELERFLLRGRTPSD